MELPAPKPNGTWVQTDRAVHEAWNVLIRRSPVGAQIMHVLAARIGDHNAVVISQAQLSKIVNRSERAVRMAIKVLRDDNWVEVRQLGGTASVNAYVVNDRVAWAQSRDGRRYSLFSAAVIAADEEQPDRDSLGQQAALRRIPDVHSGEAQLPAGDGLPPVSQPALPGMDPDLPARLRSVED